MILRRQEDREEKCRIDNLQGLADLHECHDPSILKGHLHPIFKLILLNREKLKNRTVRVFIETR